MINQVILSCNEDPIYSEFWPIVADAYRAMGFKPHLAFLTNRDEFDPLVSEFVKHGKVTLFRPLPDIPEFGQAKMIRFILASMQKEDVVYTDDIDLFPLSKNFILDAVNQRPENVLLCVGAEVYGWQGTCPVSQMTAEGFLWKKLVNPKNLSYSELIYSWTGYFYDVREKINVQQTLTDNGFKDDVYFSDERLIRRLLRETPIPIINIQRGYSNHLESTIDRQTFHNGIWEYDKEKLFSHGYYNAHCIRPYKQYSEQFEPLIEYIKENYG